MKKDNCNNIKTKKNQTCFSAYKIALSVFKYKMIKNFKTFNCPCMRKTISLSKLWCYMVYLDIGIIPTNTGT